MNPDNQGFVDLHTHTRFSDGKLSPEELVEHALFKGLSAIALTDHDNIDGLGRFAAAGRARRIETIAGVELSCEQGGTEVHIVGLFLAEPACLRERLLLVRTERESRMQRMVDKLRSMGFDLHMDDIQQKAGRSFGRPHLARAMTEKGIVRNTAEAFARYIGDDGPAYVPKARLQVREAIDLIHCAGGISVLGHPGLSGLVSAIPEYAAMGLDAVEAYYPKHAAGDTRAIIQAARSCNLGISGGSDFHGQGEGGELGYAEVPYRVLTMLRELHDAVCRKQQPTN